MNIPLLHQLFSTHKAGELYGRYINLNSIQPLIDKLTHGIEVDIIGYSVENRPIHKITVGSGPRKVLMWSQMHGNESTTTKVIFDILNVLIESAENQVANILESCTMCIIPMLNPDGAEMYTRVNANDIDLNRDAQDLSQPESMVLREVFDQFNPDYCFNLHGQRSIFSAGKHKEPAVLSFLAPAKDADYSIPQNRKVAMDLIYRIQNALEIVLSDKIGIYDDAFNSNCVGDTFQGLGACTILFEAGHFPEDYQRETTRELMFKAMLIALDLISHATDLGKHHKFYFQIPQNEKLFRDIIIRNALIDGVVNDIAIQYQEVLKDNLVEFSPVIETIEPSLDLFGHREIDAKFNLVTGSSEIKATNEIVYVEINNEKFSLYA